jgi:hypothetical protein
MDLFYDTDYLRELYSNIPEAKFNNVEDEHVSNLFDTCIIDARITDTHAIDAHAIDAHATDTDKHDIHVTDTHATDVDTHDIHVTDTHATDVDTHDIHVTDADTIDYYITRAINHVIRTTYMFHHNDVHCDVVLIGSNYSLYINSCDLITTDPSNIWNKYFKRTKYASHIFRAKASLDSLIFVLKFHMKKYFVPRLSLKPNQTTNINSVPPKYTYECSIADIVSFDQYCEIYNLAYSWKVSMCITECHKYFKEMYRYKSTVISRYNFHINGFSFDRTKQIAHLLPHADRKKLIRDVGRLADLIFHYKITNSDCIITLGFYIQYLEVIPRNFSQIRSVMEYINSPSFHIHTIVP